MTKKPSLQLPGCRTLSTVSPPPLPGQVATQEGGRELWPKRQSGGAPRGRYICGRTRCEKRTKDAGNPGSLFFSAPSALEAVPGRGRAGQDRASLGHSSGPGSPMTAVFCGRFPSCSAGGSHGVTGWKAEDRGARRREVNRRPQREPVPCAQRTPAASGPPWEAVCVEMQLGVGGSERRANTHFPAVTHSARLSRPSAHAPAGGGAPSLPRPHS